MSRRRTVVPASGSPRRVVGGELVFERRRQQDVAVDLERVGRLCDRCGAGEVQNRFGAIAVLDHRILVQAARIDDGAFALCDRDDAGALRAEESGGVIPDVAKSLHDDALALEAGRQAEGVHVDGVGARRAQRVHQAAARRLRPAPDSALRDRLAGDARNRIEMSRVERGVGVHDPPHLALAGAGIGRGDVEARTDQVLSRQFVRIPASDPFEQIDRRRTRVDLDRALGAAERHIDDGALVRHQRRERLDLGFVGVQAEANAALGRQLVMTVLGAPRAHHFDMPVVVPDGKPEGVDAVARADLAQQSRGMGGERRRAVEVHVDVVFERSRCVSLGEWWHSGVAMMPIRVPVGKALLDGDLDSPSQSTGLVLFAHGSGSSRHSPRNQAVAAVLQQRGFATLLIDLLTKEEEAVDERTAHLRFDIPMLADRLAGVADWLTEHPETSSLSIGLFGASTGGGAALVAATLRPSTVAAVVSRGGRPDLAGAALPHVTAPTLLIVGSRDTAVIQMNRDAMARMTGEVALEIVPGATHLFEEPGALERVSALAADWFERHLAAPGDAPRYDRRP
jgi:dienelactone hydrolase